MTEATDPDWVEGQLSSNVAPLAEQVASMKTSISSMESLLTILPDLASLEAQASQLEGSVAAVKEHIASVEAGLSEVNATLVTMKLQKEIAYVAGALKVQIASLEDSQIIQAAILSLENGVSEWLGKDFNNYVGVESELAALSTLAASVEAQSLTTDALASDIEAGLRVGDATEELAAMAETVANNAQELAKLTSEFEALSNELEETYTNAIKSTDSDTENVLKSVNAKATAALKGSAVTLMDLASRVSACEEKIVDIQGRLTQIEADVAELLSKIQSLTFMSEYSEEYAVAYYSMEPSKVSAPGKPYDGKSRRTPVSNIELNYMVRPAATASAVTKDVVSVVGYYADQIQTKAIDPARFVNFAVSDVAVTNAERGIVTVTITHDLKDDFYYRQTGAKCALFVATGKTDLSSKFIELYPKDNSATVYVEGIKLNQEDFEIDEGQSKTLTATVNPSSATNKMLTWTSSDPSIVSIDQSSGVMKAEKQGNATITVTTDGTDEWGDNLRASVNVKVNPSMRLGGPLYVEVGKTAELSLDFPSTMNIESKVWMTSDETKATVENGVVTGVAHTYNPYAFQYNTVTITCIVNGNITLAHEISVAVPQPRQIKLNNYGDDVKSVSMKVDQAISLAGSIVPENVDASLFRMTYESDGGLGWINFDTGEIKAPGSVGVRYVYIKVKDKDKHTYMKTFVERTVIVSVEPYYVKSVTLPATMNLAPGATATLTPSFTSDVDGKQPTNTSLTWTSSDSSIVSIDSETGEMTAEAEGTVTITAATSSGATSDSSVMTATCVVTVKASVAEIVVGEYYYSDGTWGNDPNPSGKTVVGVIFSNANAVAEDPVLARDYPKCSNGLVIAKAEYADQDFGSISAYNGHGYYAGLGYDAAGIVSTEKVNGYGNTLAHRDLNASRPGYCAFFNATDGVVAAQTASVAVPSSASSWYIPSYREMKLMYDNLSTINASLAKIGGTPINSQKYWSSTIYGKWYASGQSYDHFKYPFNMSTGGWHSAQDASGKFPVRVVLAF